jgi:thiosulfate reductase cytochrome b subunit
LLLAILFFYTGTALGQDDTKPLHPTFAFLDKDGNKVLDSGNPISTMTTCGTCHDTTFIAEHSVHADAGLSLIGSEVSREWQLSNGWYGAWSPFYYHYLSSDDLNLTEWIQTYGLRHAGGGPAEEAGIEMNCFLCHLNTPNNEARIAELQAGNFEWANTATLVGTGLVELKADTWVYNAAMFDEDGELLPQYVALGGAPTNLNCGQCHGVVDNNAQIPLVFDLSDSSQWNTLTTGQVFSPQRISNSGMNIEDKDKLSRSWDIHAERAVNCVDCHYSLNNPIFYIEGDTSRPEHLQFDPRRMELGDYLYRPLHQFANGGTDYVGAFPIFERASRDCASCHDAVSTHTWLPYADRHTENLACETCHIPQLNAPALESIDWTVLDAEGNALMSYRGIDPDSEPALLTGYQPVLLPQTDGDNTVLAPYNLVSAWYWVSGEAAQPVPLETLQAAWFEGDTYAPDILMTFDNNDDGILDDRELFIDSDEKETLITERLIALGMDNPHIVAEVEAHAIHHDVTYGEWAISDCETCHSDNSRLTATMTIANRTPGEVEPTFITTNGATLNGELKSDNGALYYVPQFDIEPSNLYVFGKSNLSLIDWFGVLLFLATLLGVTVHGGLRYLALRRMPVPEEPKLREVYMYSIYERQWHWLQTVVIFGLIFTGLVIHKPEMFGMFSFRYIVLVHNALALLLLINAALAAFYHLVSGEIQQFLPEPRGFFGKMFAQAKYYLWGIFHNEPHPFEKTPQQKMNPIQQVTYFGLLNVLLPLQVITGSLMWGAQRWPEITASLGGLPFLAPFHSLIAWLLSTFIVLHVYMTTTGHTPVANIKAMIMGWDEVEVHNQTGGQNS